MSAPWDESAAPLQDVLPEPPQPFAQLAGWGDRLTRIAHQPLGLCEEFPRIAQRFEAWWACDTVDRPIFIGTANANPARPITRRLDLLDNPAAWLDAKRTDMRQRHRVGDALPQVRVDFGPVLLGPLVGGRTEVGSDTTWTHPMIHDDWRNAPTGQIDQNHPWWNLLLHLLDITAEDAKGQYLVATPDLGGSADVLLNLRGSSDLCMDVFDQPEPIVRTLARLYGAWRRAFVELYNRPLAHNAGVVHWLHVWSSVPYMVPACDFNFMIGPDEFAELFLPEIECQATTVGRAVFHLDGPGATRHIDTLLESPAIQAIQFTPGAGSRSVLPWMDMYRKIQRAGRALYIFCPSEEVLQLSEALDPQGLAISLDNALDVKSLDALFAAFQRQHGCA